MRGAAQLRANLARSRRDPRDDNGSLQIADLGSTNGTFVNAQRIETATVLVSGDVIHVGDQELRLAEGIEDAANAHACAAIGIDLFQGFY